jgi:hypothetical protein
VISLDDYFAGYADRDIPDAHRDSADLLLRRVNPLLEHMVTLGWEPTVGTHTHTMVSGQRDGGWRPQDCPIGAPNSAHKVGRAVDVADADGSLDEVLTDEILEQFGLFRESPTATAGWVHLTDRAPHSGRRTFMP